MQALTDQDVNATVVTIDGVGACDLISRNAMLEGLLRMEGGDQIFPFAWLFCGTPWEQGDPFMPMLSSLGEHPALEAIQRRFLDDEKLFAHFDDVIWCANQTGCAQ